MQIPSHSRSVLFISGPTASGKTDLALYLKASLSMSIDLISVDSTLVYKGLDIGSGKPSQAILQQTPHYLVDIAEPSQIFSVGLFRELALEKIEESFKNNRVPCLVGGTMMYFKALVSGLNQAPARDEPFRRALLERANREGVENLHKELASIDKISAAKIHPNDYKRIERALEIFYLSGKTKAEHIEAQAQPSDFTILHMALTPLITPREKLHENIAVRFHHMLKSGFIEEVEQLKKRGDLSLELPSIRSVGYQQIWRYLEGEYNKESMIEKALTATRQLAKHQLTWLRAWENVQFFDFAQPDLHQAVLNYLHHKLI